MSGSAARCCTRSATATSEDFIVGFRMTADQCIPDGGMTPADLREVARAITAGGAVDLLSISNGTGYTNRTSSYFVPGDELPDQRQRAPRRVDEAATGVPVLVAGRILDVAPPSRR